MDNAMANEQRRNGEWGVRFLVERYKKQAVAYSAVILGNCKDALRKL